MWLITRLYLGPVAVWGYWGLAARRATNCLSERQQDEPPDKPGWATTAIGVSHCGAGCIPGDIMRSFAMFGIGLVIAGEVALSVWATICSPLPSVVLNQLIECDSIPSPCGG